MENLNKKCNDDKCVLGHICTSDCQNTKDCPCLAEHPREGDLNDAEQDLELEAQRLVSEEVD
mgnify:CR=1 FL=1